ncbi:MAG: hypothetical protein KatS3mg105_1723 [Gemmatales bacterium]|nr:MAG: hypothetical protein KatS3mg105_1723 [Gemmatales bacterium]
MRTNALARYVYRGFIRLHILHHAAKEPVYGAEIADELERHGYRLSAGTLYPILHGLVQAGLVTSATKVVAGRRRKYYRATAAGRRMLAEARQKLHELVMEVLEGDDKEFEKIKQKHRRMKPRRAKVGSRR